MSVLVATFSPTGKDEKNYEINYVFAEYFSRELISHSGAAFSEFMNSMTDPLAAKGLREYPDPALLSADAGEC